MPPPPLIFCRFRLSVTFAALMKRQSAPDDCDNGASTSYTPALVIATQLLIEMICGCASARPAIITSAAKTRHAAASEGIAQQGAVPKCLRVHPNVRVVALPCRLRWFVRPFRPSFEFPMAAVILL